MVDMHNVMYNVTQFEKFNVMHTLINNIMQNVISNVLMLGLAILHIAVLRQWPHSPRYK